MIKILSVLFSIISFLNAQNIVGGVYSDVLLFHENDNFELYFFYRVENNSIVFEKKNGFYSAEYRIHIEIIDSQSNIITRDIKEESVKVTDFETTKSNRVSTTGLMKFVLPNGSYELKPRFTDLSNNRDIELFPLRVNAVINEYSKFYRPIIINSIPVRCDTSTHLELFNYGGSFPFSENEYEFLIPVSDSTLKKVLVLINTGGEEHKFESNESFYISHDIIICNNSILLKKDANRGLKVFRLKNFSQLINEGRFTAKLASESFEQKDTLFAFDSRWFNKPVALRNLDFAIQVLKNIEDKDVIDSLTKGNSNAVKEKFDNYWKRYDPTPSTKFNELMNEFYLRVDFAVNNYSSLDKRNGADTDRGKTYLRFGKPDRTERTVSHQGRITEIWYYDKIGREFFFVDVRGTGNFQIQKEK